MEEKEQEKVTLKPWEGKATRTDKFLIATPLVLMAVMLAFRPFHPFLLANNPILLAAITGSTSSVGAAGAFASVEGTSLILPVLAGIVGSIKFSWLFWWAGRRWGKNVIKIASPTDSLQRRLYKVQNKPWWGRAAAFLAYLPGFPSLILQLFAGWQKMKLATFLLFSALGAGVWTTVVALLGYASGQKGVDLVMLIDKYALWISLGIMFWLVFYSAGKAKRIEENKQKAASELAAKDGNEPDEANVEPA